MVRLTSRARPPAAPRARVQAPRGRFATPGLVPKGLNQSHSEKLYWVSQKKGRFWQIKSALSRKRCYYKKCHIWDILSEMLG